MTEPLPVYARRHKRWSVGFHRDRTFMWCKLGPLVCQWFLMVDGWEVSVRWMAHTPKDAA